MNTKIVKLKALSQTVLWKQSLFGLPWTIAGALLPFCFYENISFSRSLWLYILLAFLSARFTGMSLNRLIDSQIDKENPRTAERALPKGDLSRNEVFFSAVLFLLFFFFCSSQINSLCFAISPLVAALLVLYSYTKRFTSLCHYVLALIHFLSPICAWAAMTGRLAFPPLFLGLAQGLSIAANDIIYACQDMEFDRAKKLFSIPARFGKKSALFIAGFSHFVSLTSLLLLGLIFKFSAVYFFCISAIGLVFVATYIALLRNSIEKVFALSNTVAAHLFLLAIVGEIIWQK